MSQLSIKDIIEQARAYERDPEYKEAEGLYLDIARKHPAHIEAFERLMIIYRKQKLYKKELAIIHKAIKSYLDYASSHTKSLLSGNKKAAALSRQLAKQSGMIDRRGKPVGEDEIVIKWRKREAIVKKRLDKVK